VHSPHNRVGLAFPLIAITNSLCKARQYILASLPLRAIRPVQGNLRAKFIVVIVSLEIVLMGAVSIVVERHQRRVILEQIRLRAFSLGSSLAALSEGYLLSYNFAKLEQAVERVTADEDDIIYAIAHLRDGRVAAFSGRNDLQGRWLDDPISQRAIRVQAVLVQHITVPQTREPGYDVAIPVYVPEASVKWGVIRLGFSLKRADLAIHQTRRDLFLLSLGAIICGTSLAILLAMRISKPIGQLVSEVHEITRGSYDHPIQVEGRDEISYLARAFEQMRKSLQLHLTGLAEEKQLLAEANIRLQETQQQLMLLAAKVAHEVNNPLAILKTSFQIIRVQRLDKDTLEGQLLLIEQEIDRIGRIIREILAFSRPNQKDEVVEASAVVESLKLLLEQNLSERQIALKLLLQPGLPRVRISSDHLKQVVLNMVRNAEDAMPNGGQIAIQTVKRGSSVELSITDTGCGIPEAYLSRLFDPFFTTKETDTERGMGLGLAVSYGIIRGAGGSIEVESEVGKGSTFRVLLPGCEAEQGA
jgi:signal transduction histidine kinase